MKAKRILIVDDETNILDSLSGILTDEGYSISTAENGDDALALLQERPFDLVLLDIWLPGRRDGLQTLREMRKRNINAEVIMISGHGSIDTAVKATKLGAYNFIEKPLSLDHVLETIESALKSRHIKGDDELGDSIFRYIGVCPAMIDVKKAVEKGASSDDPLLLIGEMGTGKEYVARYIHAKSKRKNDPFIKVSCRNLSPAAFERLFGPLEDDSSSKGSPFSILSGTVFLKDPHFLKKNMHEKLGDLVAAAKRRRKRHLSFIAAMTVLPGPARKGMPKALSALFDTLTIELPPLRDRGSDIALFIDNFMEDAAEDFGKAGVRLSQKAAKRMLDYPWPGNVMELQSVVENMMMACSSKQIEPEDIPFGGSLDAMQTDITNDLKSVAKTFKRGKAKGRPPIIQKTLKRSAVLTGLGIHSGIKTGLILSPLPPNSGIIFSDISTGRQVRALLDFVESTDYSTTLRMGITCIRTIEHFMATLHMYGITNALVKVGEEVPIMDGSAVRFCELMENAGIADQEEPVEPIVVKEKITVGENAEDGKFLTIEPSDRLIVEYRMDYPPPVGKIRASFKSGVSKNFKTEIAPARTFGFVKQLKQIIGKGVGEGGNLDNFILIDDQRVINTTLRFDDEFARHKILDILGDIYLLGRPLIGKITASMTGHTENIALLRKIRHSLRNKKDEQRIGA